MSVCEAIICVFPMRTKMKWRLNILNILESGMLPFRSLLRTVLLLRWNWLSICIYRAVESASFINT